MNKLNIAFMLFMLASAYLFFAPVFVYTLNKRKIEYLERIIGILESTNDSIFRELLSLGGKVYETEQQEKNINVVSINKGIDKRVNNGKL